MGLLSAEMGGQSQRNSEQQIVLESTTTCIRCGIKEKDWNQPSEQDSYAEKLVMLAWCYR